MGLFTRGRSYFTTCLVPALGLNLSPCVMVVRHVESVAPLLHYLHLGLFPYILPLDPGVRHCD